MWSIAKCSSVSVRIYSLDTALWICSERVFNVTAKPAYDLAGVARRQPAPRFGRARERAACAFWAPSLLPPSLAGISLRQSAALPRTQRPLGTRRALCCLATLPPSLSFAAGGQEPVCAGKEQLRLCSPSWKSPAPLQPQRPCQQLWEAGSCCSWGVLGGRRGCARALLQHQERKRPARPCLWRGSRALVHPLFLGDEGSTVP